MINLFVEIPHFLLWDRRKHRKLRIFSEEQFVLFKSNIPIIFTLCGIAADKCIWQNSDFT
jgi:hypothetical protein